MPANLGTPPLSWLLVSCGSVGSSNREQQSHERMRGNLKRLRDVIGQQIFVLLCKARDVVNDVTRVVLYLKLWRVKLAGLLIVRVLVLLEIKLMHPAKKIFIVTSDRPFFIHKLEERGLTDAFGLE